MAHILVLAEAARPYSYCKYDAKRSDRIACALLFLASQN